ncbi:MAG: histidine kinase [Actinobacteria bacterium]|nr:histidine kinase [Actinomycetota bacterium]
MTARPVRSLTIDPRIRAPELLLAAAATLLILLEIWVLDQPELRLARSVPGIAAGVSLAFLRTKPFAAYLMNGVAIVTLIALGHPSDFYQWTNLIAIFGASSRLELREASLVLAFGVAGVVFYFIRFPDEAPLTVAAAVLAIWIAAWFAGRAQFSRLREAEVTHDRDVTRAELAARQAGMELEEERSRVARELHDIIGHSVNVMVLHAGAGQGAVETDPATARRSLETIAATGRKALADLDLMLDVLHGEAGNRPLPGIEQLDELCRSVAETGLSVDLSVTGDRSEVNPSLGVTVYRIVQEGLTNVIKHAEARQVSVEVAIGNEVSIALFDDGVGGDGHPGRGLRGIEERAYLHGGTVTYGDGADGGFELRCRLPLGAVP